MKKHIIILLIICFQIATSSLLAQKNKNEEYEQFKKQYIEDLKNFRDRENKEFSEFVSKYWEDFKVFKGKQAPVKPKPNIQPVSETNKVQSQPSELKTAPLIKNPSIKHTKAEYNDTGINNPNNIKIGLNFCGEQIQINTDPSMSIKITSIEEAEIGKTWELLSKTDYLSTLRDLNESVNSLDLNDWSYFLLVKQLANKIFKPQSSENILFTSFILNQSGYDVRMCKINNDKLSLLAATSNEIYALPYIEIDGTTYYILSKNEEVTSVSTYNKNFPSAEQNINMNLSKIPNFKPAIESRIVADNNPEIKAQVTYNKNDLFLYNAYPMCDLSIYINAPVSKVTEKSLKETFGPKLKNLAQLEQVNLILEFVQSLPYKTDEEQFGTEKYFFPDEVFYYPYCDCEDRAAIFSWMVRALTGLQTIGLEYSDHVSTAVKFTEPVNGDYISIDGEKYIICDPTYIGAPVGLAMPQYKNSVAEIIL